MVEEQCVAQARGGDASAFEELVRTYEAPVYRLALRMCGGRAEDAQEVAQEAFFGGVARAAPLSGPVPVFLVAV